VGGEAFKEYWAGPAGACHGEEEKKGRGGNSVFPLQPSQSVREIHLAKAKREINEGPKGGEHVRFRASKGGPAANLQLGKVAERGLKSSYQSWRLLNGKEIIRKLGARPRRVS